MKRILLPFLFYLFTALLTCSDSKNDHTLVDNEVEAPLKKEPIQSLKDWLAKPVDSRTSLETLNFATQPLTKSQAKAATEMLFQDKQSIMANHYEEQWNDRVLEYNGYRMCFDYQRFGDNPLEGRSLFISLHGGGQASADVNDQQYENQKHLYDRTMNHLEGIYLAPRAPTNTWDLWHQDHIDDFLNLIIQLAVIKEKVNTNKVYLLGYSAGGDGVYQLAPRMADRWAAASMMAGHPNDASPLGLRNTPFAIHVGALDNAYHRNSKAQEWKVELDKLQNNDPGAYIHHVELHEGLGHWMKLSDADALSWMKKYTRNPIPTKVVWKQDDRHHASFYWLGVPENLMVTGGEIKVEYKKSLNEINIMANYSKTLKIFVNDDMLNLDHPVTIKYQGKSIYQGTFVRSILNIYKTLSTKGDAKLSFPCIITVRDNQKVEQ